MRRSSLTPLLLIGWCLVYWGTFLDVVFALNVLTEGATAAAAAWRRLSPANAALSVAAALVWAFVAVSAAVGRRARPTG